MFQMTSRDLSAPELSVLRREARGNGREALRMAVVELVERGVLRREGNGDRLRLQLTQVPDDLRPPLAAVAATLDSAPKSLRTLEHELSLTWATPRAYVWSQVVPLLCDRGLARIADRRALRCLGPKLVLTPAGREARARAAERLARTGLLFGTGGALAGGLNGWAMGGGGFGDGGGTGGCGGDGGGGGGC